jgi:20S proteasome subunit beta 1
MACQYKGGVVLGADSRTSTGTYVANRASDKITQVTDNVWMCRSGSVRGDPATRDTPRRSSTRTRVDPPPARRLSFGDRSPRRVCSPSSFSSLRPRTRRRSNPKTTPAPPRSPSSQAADTQNVCAYVKNLVEEHNMQRRGDADPGMADVKLVANLTMQLAYRNKDRLSAGMIIGGWDAKEGAQVYGIPLGGSLTRTPFTVGGSGSAYIYGWCDHTWKENMTREEAERWVARAISLAIARDASSGGVIRLVTIHESGSARQMLEPAQHPPCDDELPVIRREQTVA